MNDVHQLDSTPIAEKFACVRCSQRHETLRALKIHEARHRREDAAPVVTKMYACPWCTMTTDHARGISQHAKRCHGKQGHELYIKLHPKTRTTCIDCDVPVKFIDQEKGYCERCSACSRKYSYATKKHVAWNFGLSKDTDPRMATGAENMRNHYSENGHHNAGKTKENDESVRLKALKTSISLKTYYKTHVHWSVGMTAETSVAIAKRSKKLKGIKRTTSFTDATLENMRRAHLLSDNVVAARLLEKQMSLTTAYVDTVTTTGIRCLTCQTVFNRKIGQLFNNNAKCPTCHPPWACNVSVWQREIADFVSSIVIDCELNNRSIIAPLELDIFIPSKSFAIECNGLYWHSNAARRFSTDHAERKRLLAMEHGITLMTIFEDEWNVKRNIIESMLRHRLGFSNKIGARCLSLLTCEPRDVASNIDDWHLEGHINSSFALKLVNDHGATMGACTLRWARNGNHKVLEIARLAISPGIHIAGGISRFVACACKIAQIAGAKRLISYSDNRLGSGSGYAAAGMKLIKTTIQRFWWTDFNQRYDRFTFRADKNRGMSERQVAADAGVHRIYGCSNSLWNITL